MAGERSFAKEVELLRKGDGEFFEGEGILAITKALLQSGVAYIGGYQGAPAASAMSRKETSVQPGEAARSSAAVMTLPSSVD